MCVALTEAILLIPPSYFTRTDSSMLMPFGDAFISVCIPKDFFSTRDSYCLDVLLFSCSCFLNLSSLKRALGFFSPSLVALKLLVRWRLLGLAFAKCCVWIPLVPWISSLPLPAESSKLSRDRFCDLNDFFLHSVLKCFCVCCFLLVRSPISPFSQLVSVYNRLRSDDNFSWQWSLLSL